MGCKAHTFDIPLMLLAVFGTSEWRTRYSFAERNVWLHASVLPSARRCARIIKEEVEWGRAGDSTFEYSLATCANLVMMRTTI